MVLFQQLLNGLQLGTIYGLIRPWHSMGLRHHPAAQLPHMGNIIMVGGLHRPSVHRLRPCPP